MAMTWTSLTAAKTQPGSILNWVGYGKIDVTTVLDEAQSLLFGLLRLREMRTEWVFGMSAGACRIALPNRFLDPIGRLWDITNGIKLGQKIESEVEAARAYDTSLGGSFGTNPFTAVLDSSTVSAHLVAHNLTQASTITIAGSATVGGLTMNGTNEVLDIVDADNFEIDMGDQVATSNATGGGGAITYTANQLISSTPSRWAVWNDMIQFDAAFEQDTQFKQLYFRAPPLLSSTVPTNILTTRYPKLLRVATNVASAEFMKDDEEYTKSLAALEALVQSINAENDLIYRGAEFGTDTPTPGDYY